MKLKNVAKKVLKELGERGTRDDADVSAYGLKKPDTQARYQQMLAKMAQQQPSATPPSAQAKLQQAAQQYQQQRHDYIKPIHDKLKQDFDVKQSHKLEFPWKSGAPIGSPEWNGRVGAYYAMLHMKTSNPEHQALAKKYSDLAMAGAQATPQDIEGALAALRQQQQEMGEQPTQLKTPRDPDEEPQGTVIARPGQKRPSTAAESINFEEWQYIAGIKKG